MADFIPCKNTVDVVNMVHLYFWEVYHLHGLPISIVSDRDTLFLGHFWSSLWRLTNIKLNFSTACHPQTDGQMEVINRSLGDLLRCLVGDHSKIWDQKVYSTEFAYNRLINRSTRFSPFHVVYNNAIST